MGSDPNFDANAIVAATANQILIFYPRHMDLRTLRYCEAIARLGSMTRASEVQIIARPALSVAVKKLENELGVTLFTRQPNRGITPTPEGRMLLKRAERLFQEVDSARRELADANELRTGEVKIGMPPMYGLRIFPPLMAAFHQKYPEITMNAIEGSAGDVGGLLDSGEMCRWSMTPRLRDSVGRRCCARWRKRIRGSLRWHSSRRRCFVSICAGSTSAICRAPIRHSSSSFSSGRRTPLQRRAHHDAFVRPAARNYVVDRGQARRNPMVAVLAQGRAVVERAIDRCGAEFACTANRHIGEECHAFVIPSRLRRGDGRRELLKRRAFVLECRVEMRVRARRNAAVETAHRVVAARLERVPCARPSGPCAAEIDRRRLHFIGSAAKSIE